jgi:hypothetical protein
VSPSELDRSAKPRRRRVPTLGLTLRRAIEIEQGNGPPPTRAESTELAQLEVRFRPMLQHLDKAITVVRKVAPRGDLERAAAAMSIYKAAPRGRQRYLGRMTPRQLLGLEAQRQVRDVPGRVPRPAARTPRSRSVRRTRSTTRAGPSSSSDDSDLASPCASARRRA